MAAKPESSFIASIHRLLPPPDELHREKMNNPYSSGTADVWYSGKQDLWVEYKFVILPKRTSTIIDLCHGKSPSLSVLQQHWLNNRADEGRDVWVIVGCKEGGVILKDKAWMRPWTSAKFKDELLGRIALASELINFLRPS